MPHRAKKLFTKTFLENHKLNAGDEEVALIKAKKALEDKYVKVNLLRDSWIPRKAAYEIIKDDIDNEDDDDVNFLNKTTLSSNKNYKNDDNNYNSSSDYESDDENLKDTSESDNEHLNDKNKQSHFQHSTKKRKRFYVDTSDDDEENFIRNKKFTL